MWISLLLWLTALWVGRSFGQFYGSEFFFFPGGLVSPLLIKVGDWTAFTTPNTTWRANGAEILSARSGQILLSFRARFFALFISRPPGSSISVWLDGIKLSTLPFVPEANSTSNSTWISGLQYMDTLESEVLLDDHQIVIDVSSPTEAVLFDRIELTVPNPPPIPEDLSVIAKSVPAGTTTDDRSPLLLYSDSGWSHEANPFSHDNTTSVTSIPGSWVQVSFAGTGIWVYGAISIEGAVYTVEAIKGYGSSSAKTITTHNATRPDLDIPIYQVPLFKEPNLPYSNLYVYNITLVSGALNVDFIRILGNVIPARPEVLTSSATTSRSHRNIIIISITSLVSIALVIAVVYFISRRYLSKRWSSRRTYNGKENDVDRTVAEPFYHVSASCFTSRRERTKGCPSYSHTSASIPPNPSVTDIVPTNGSSHTGSLLDISNSTDLASYGPSRIPDDTSLTADQPVSLSHSDLARVFRRAEELRLGSEHAGASSSSDASGELAPNLESLARQLARMESRSE